MTLFSSDLFVFCTDGVFDAINEQGTEFGTQRLVEVVKAHRHAEVRQIVDGIEYAARECSKGGAPQDDDMTSVAVRNTT